MQELMKKIVYAIAALALIFTGCAKELDNSTKDNFSTVRLHVKVADQLTKVSADNDGRYHWQGGDKITVFDNKQASFVFSTENGGSDVDFGATSWSGEDLGKYAMYPASSHSVNGNVVGFNLPSSYKWKANSTNMPMLGKINEDVATFKAVGGVLKLVCYNVPADAVKMEFSATNKKISGSFNIDNAAVENPIIVTAAMAESNNKVSFDFTGERKDNMVFYIPLPTGTIDGFTVSFLSDVPEVVFTKTSTKTLSVSRNQLIIAPALNCASDTILWTEDFGSFTTGTQAGKSNIVYATTSCSVRSENYAAGTSPEMMLSGGSGVFTVTDIPTGGESALTLKYKTNKNELNLSSTTEGVSFSPNQTTTLEEHTISITNTNNAAKISIIFTAGSKNIRLDDICLYIPGTSATAPTISSDDDALEITVGSLTATTSVSLNNPVDALGISCVVNDEAKSWLSASISTSISGTTLTVTAAEANSTAADRDGTVTLKATGAANVVISVTQPTKMVATPSVTATAGDSKFTATWAAVPHATSYVAYLHTAPTATPATGGTNITASISESAGTYSITDYPATNDTRYYLYVKVNEVESNYEAVSEYAVVDFTPEEAKGTAENPYLANELYTAIATGIVSDNTSVYVKGYVSYASNPSSNSQSYYISDDGTGGNSGTLQIYQGKGISGANMTTSNRVNVGDWVVVHGNTLYYNSSKPEINSGSELVTHYYFDIDYDEVEWAWNETSAEVFTVSINASGDYKTFTHAESGMDDWATVSVAENVITITPKNNNKSLVDDREGTVTIHHASDLFDDIVISCKQTKAPAHSITIDSKTSLTVDLDGDHTNATVLDVVSVYSPWSVKTVTGDSAADGFTYSVNTSTNKLTITPKADNTTGSKREGIGTIVLTDSSNGDLCTITLNQANKAAVSVIAAMSSICTSTTYASYEDDDWLVTCGSSNGAFGCNSSNADSKMKLGDNYVVATPLNSGITSGSTYYAALISKKKLSAGITSITLSGTLGSGMTVGVTVSSDGTTWTKLADFGSDTDFSFSSQPSQYYAIVIHAANKSNARYTGFSAEFSE